MRTFSLLFFIFAMISFFASACVKDENATITINYGYDYYPLQIGKFKVFQVDSIIFDTTATGKVKIDSVRTYFKEVVTDTFRNQLNEKIFTIERFERKKPSDKWLVKDVISSQQLPGQLLRTEQGFKFIKMVFPLKKRQDWNSLVFVDTDVDIEIAGELVKVFEFWESETNDVKLEETINGKKYANVATIFHANSTDNKLSLRTVVEKYAKGVGLISAESQILDSQATASNEPWRKKAQKGFIYKAFLIEGN